MIAPCIAKLDSLKAVRTFHFGFCTAFHQRDRNFISFAKSTINRKILKFSRAKSLKLPSSHSADKPLLTGTFGSTNEDRQQVHHVQVA